MVQTSEKVQRQIERLQKLADRLRAKEVAGVIRRIRTAIEHYEFTPADLFDSASSFGKRTTSRNKTILPVKYRDENGNEWRGRGSRPRWLVAALRDGRTIEEFAVKPH